MGDLTKNFSRKEFACPCCGKDDISLTLVETLQFIRDKAGPLHINSGVRCPAHNKSIGGKPKSSHLKGLAVDIRCKASTKRFKILRAVFSLLIFPRIGPGPGFIHLDIDPDKAQWVCWDYHN